MVTTPGAEAPGWLAAWRCHRTGRRAARCPPRRAGRADPPGDLPVEFLGNGGDGAGIVAAELGEGDVQLPGVTRVPFDRGVATLLEPTR